MSNTTNFVRNLNGYRLVFLPDHPKAMKNANWSGYVYEHIAVVEEMLGRPLHTNEVVHHLNGDRSNNKSHNLLVLERSQHAKLHMWLSAGAPGSESFRENGENSLKANFDPAKYCKVCGNTLQDDRNESCSVTCNALLNRKVVRPTKLQLNKDIHEMSMLKVGAKYGVSDNAVRKWMKSYGLKKPTMSRAEVTTSEGAETSGEVKPS